MNFVFRFLNRVDLSAMLRLALLLMGPAASLAIQGHSPEFFGLVMLTNFAGVVCGVILFKIRLANPAATFLELGGSP